MFKFLKSLLSTIILKALHHISVSGTRKSHLGDLSATTKDVDARSENS